MAHFNASTDSGLAELNHHLEGHSYVDGWNPSQNDVVVYEKVASLANAPDAKHHAHVVRWFKHMQSWSTDERSAWPAGAAPGAPHTHSHSHEHKDGKCHGHEHEHAAKDAKAAAKDAKADAKAAAKDAKPAAPKKDDEFDLFGEEEDEEHEKLLEQRRKEHEEKKKASGKVVVAKSSVILEVKPWDDETDLVKMEAAVRSVEMEGLLWGAGKLVPIGYGIRKLQIIATIVDDLVSVDDLQERIQAFEDLVQSVDIAAFNKL